MGCTPVKEIPQITINAVGIHVQYRVLIERALNGEIVISQQVARNILDVLIKEHEKYVASNGEPCKLLAELISAWIPCAISSTKQPRGQ